MRLKRNVNFRVDENEWREIERMARQWGCPHSEVWRRLLYTVRVIYSPDLMLSDVLQVNDETIEIHKLLARGRDMPLHRAMRSIPELARILRAKETFDLIEKEKRRARTSRP